MTLPLRRVPRLLAEDDAIVDIVGRRARALSVPEPAWALTLATIAADLDRRPMLIAVPTGAHAQRLHDDLAAYVGDDEVEIFPAWETLPFERVSPGIETMGQRMRVLARLADTNTERRPKMIVAPIRALVQRLGPGFDAVEPITVGVGDVVDLDDLIRSLHQAGYRREYQVEHRGEFAVRGSIVDVYPAVADAPVRIDLWGDEIDRIVEFGIADQRSTLVRSEIELYPAREIRPSEELGERAAALVATQPWGREQWERFSDEEFFDGMESWLPWLTDEEQVLVDLLDEDASIVLVEPSRLRDRAGDILAEEADLAATLSTTWGSRPGSGTDNDDADESPFPRLHLPFDRLMAHTPAPSFVMSSARDVSGGVSVDAVGWDPLVAGVDPLVEHLAKLIDSGHRLVLAADGEASAERFLRLLDERGLAAKRVDEVPLLPEPGVFIAVARLERGAHFPQHRFGVLCEQDFTGRRRTHRRARKRTSEAAHPIDDLQPGDHVVHHQHGVARYAGMVTRAIGGTERDYLLLEYRGDDKLYVPTDQIDNVRPYTGGESPSLHRLGGDQWQKSKSKVRSAVQEIAQELVVLYQRRVSSTGHAFSPDTPWQRQLAESFPYQETPDQLRAIADVKADMEAEAPMDRLVCGDVGFGKTEIAVRAAFKAIQDGKQVALLVPTTLLAQQHLQTFRERYAEFPTSVEAISRFLTAAQAREVLERVEAGQVDLLIGTHRLLSGDVRFKDLGLLIIDEEQRFGVKHKEAIKEFRADIDVLTLTATPIPRTLEMSLTGIRDLSLLNTPPADRQPILTHVGEYDERAVAEAIRRELLREGQVFFVHNRVMDIEHVSAGLRELVPEARIAIAHGQMDEGSLERVVIDFWEGEYDVLVCTTIIESGIDMPTVNTLVADRADLLGLGQMHQLRGRVGRSGQRAYAYLFTPRDHSLSEEAYERLKTIGETTELGSGFRIAMRDLEIRGAGNLLGTGQSGHIAAVGYDLYCQLVTEAVAELKGEVPTTPVEIKIDLPVPAFLPDVYVTRAEQRFEAYRRLAAVTSNEEVDDVAAEWADRYGPLPEPAEALIDAARLRVECLHNGVRDVQISAQTGFAAADPIVEMSPVKLRASRQVRLERLLPKARYNEDAGVLRAPLPPAAPLIDATIELMRTYLGE